MTKIALRTGLVALLVAGVAGTAQAQMASADANNDGVVTRAEHTASSEARFKRMDHNSDGVIDAGELARVKQFLARRAPKMAAMLDNLDANHDGKITHAEFMASSDARFGRMDTNHDGKLDKAEIDAAAAIMGGQ